MGVLAPVLTAVTAQSPSSIFIEWDNEDEYDKIEIYRKPITQTLTLLTSGYVDCVESDIGKQVKDDGGEIGELVAYYNSIQNLILLEAGYVHCFATDIGKMVEDDGVEIGVLVTYDNWTREWKIASVTTIANGSAMTIPTGKGAGTATGNSTKRSRWVISSASVIAGGSHMTITAGTGVGDADGNSVAGVFDNIVDVDGTETNYLDEGLYLVTQYCFYLVGVVFTEEDEEESDPSNEECATTYGGLQAPSDLEVTPISDTKADLIFKINSSVEDSVRIERKPDGGSYVEVAVLAPRRDFFRDMGYRTLFLLSGGYVNCIPSDIGKQVKDDAAEIGVLVDYDNTLRQWTIDSTSTIADASAMTITAGTGAGTADGASIGLEKGQKYYWKVRIKRDAPLEYSDYCTEAYATTIDNPSAPTVLAITEKEDKRLRLTWIDNSGDETGFRIEKTDALPFAADEGDLIAVIGANITEFLVTGLSPSTPYWFRARAYNVAGNSSYSNTATDTMLAQYVPTPYEEFIRKPDIELDALCEMNLGIKLTGFTLVGGKTYTYELAITDRAINDIEKIYGDGLEYTEKTSINEVEATASTFWCDTSLKILYVHTTTGANPSAFYIEGRFWLRIKSGESATFNGNFYYPLLSLDNIPSMSSEVSAFYGGSFKIASGTILLKNDEETSPKFFDKRFEDYIWRGGKLVLKIGGSNFTYTQYKEAFTSLIDRESCNDKIFSLSLMDLRANLTTIPVNKYRMADYPKMDPDQEDKVIPRVFKRRQDTPTVCIDTEYARWKFHDGPFKEVHSVKVNGETKTKDVDYYIDYQKAIVTFDQSLEMAWEKDVVAVDFTGIMDSALLPITNGAEIFKFIMGDILGLSNSDLNLDSIYVTKYASTAYLELAICKEESLAGIVHKIENSTRASTFQDEKGRIGLQVAQTVPLSNVAYVKNFHIVEDGHSQEKNTDYLFKEINVYYKESLKDGKSKWQVVTKSLPEFVWKYGKIGPLKPLDIYTYFINDVPASALADDIATILVQLEKGFVDETLPWLLYGCRAGDLIKLSKERFYSTSGTADEITVKLLKLDKAISSKQSRIKGVVVS